MSKRLVNIGAKNRIVLDSNLKSCAKCGFKNPWQNYCRFFKTKLERINQCNGGFHHNRCKECFEAEEKFDHLNRDITSQEELYASLYY